MALFNIGNIKFSISPVSIMKCWVGIGWYARSSEKAIEEYRIFTDNFFNFLFAQNNEMEIYKFSRDSINTIDEIAKHHGLETDFIKQFIQKLKGRLNYNIQECINLSEKYSRLVASWINSSFGKCGSLSVKNLEDWGIVSPYTGLGAIGTFGNAIYGKYVPSLKAVCVQLDVIANCKIPELQFLETFLHEHIHAIIHQKMGDDNGRSELTWLDELCAVLTSQYALIKAGEQLLSNIDDMKRSLDFIRNNQEYGELAEAVMHDTNNPLIAWRAWEQIFNLPEIQKKHYAKDRVITPILQQLGWNINFPYHYGKKYVTVFI